MADDQATGTDPDLTALEDAERELASLERALTDVDGEPDQADAGTGDVDPAGA